MKALLSERQVNEIIGTLKEEQKNFLENRSKLNKKSLWLETLAIYKGIVLDEKMNMEQINNKLKAWVLLDILDGGYGNRPFTCECGNSLRFQYIVHHNIENRTYKLGSTCFENYTKLSPEILRDIMKGFYHIDIERDEILLKFKKKDFFNINPYIEANIPIDILDQVKIGLPILDTQIKRILFLFEEHKLQEAENKQREKEHKRIEGLSLEQKEWIKSSFSEEEQHKTTLIEESYEKVKIIQEHEADLSERLKKDWENIKNMLEDLKMERPINYKSFHLLLNNLLASLGVYDKVIKNNKNKFH